MSMLWWTFLMFLHVAFAPVVIQGPLPFGKPSKAERKLWGLLVAGSNGYDNYRHQADVCHAYQVLRQHGIPDDQIVVMMYDDIANDTQNPTPGIILNRPNGTNVYEGVPKDYTGDTVTPKNFLRVLQGINPGVGTGKVIASGPDDHVFVYFSDHGAPGMLIFPESELHARELINVITEMHRKRNYDKIVLFIEACYSGSMFQELLPGNISAYAMTAAHAHESSYACYYDKYRSAWLGDWFSINWMEDADQQDLNKQTLGELYKIVKNKTTTSHVQRYGYIKTGLLPLSEFMGSKPVRPFVLPSISCDAVSSASAPIRALEYQISATEDSELKRSLQDRKDEILKKRDKLGLVFVNIVRTLGADLSVLNTKPDGIQFPCYEKVTAAFSKTCLKISKSPYTSTFLYSLANLCTSYTPEQIIGSLNTVCVDLQIKDVI